MDETKLFKVKKIFFTCVPIFSWLPEYKWRENLQDDLVAGLTVGLFLIAQGMAYALIAGLPPVYGLYSSLLPAFLYPFFGSSKHLSVGPVAIVSLLTSSAIQDYEPELRTLMAINLALLVGLIYLLAAILHLGQIIHLLSRPVISGFTSAAAFIIIASQIKVILGVRDARVELFYMNLYELFLAKSYSAFNRATFTLGLLSLLFLLMIRSINYKYKRNFPGPLIVTVFSTLFCFLIRDVDDSLGIAMIRTIPQGLPPMSCPRFLSFSNFQELLGNAMVIALVGLVESISIGSKLAIADNYKIDGDRELTALGFSNLFSSFCSCYPISGSFTRSAVMSHIGAKTQVASFVVGIVVMLTLGLLTPLFYYLPLSALASIIIVSCFNLVDIKEVKFLLTFHKRDLLCLVVSFLTTLIWGLEWGVVVSVLLSMGVILWFSYRPPISQLGKLAHGDQQMYRCIKRYPAAVPPRGGVVWRVDSSLYFLNVDYILETLDKLELSVRQRGEELSWIILDARNILDIDSTALEVLYQAYEVHVAEGIWFGFADVDDGTKKIMDESGISNKIGQDRFFETLEDALKVARSWAPTGDKSAARTRSQEDANYVAGQPYIDSHGPRPDMMSYRNLEEDEEEKEMKAEKNLQNNVSIQNESAGVELADVPVSSEEVDPNDPAKLQTALQRLPSYLQG